jgi:hypothetical protein
MHSTLRGERFGNSTLESVPVNGQTTIMCAESHVISNTTRAILSYSLAWNETRSIVLLCVASESSSGDPLISGVSSTTSAQVAWLPDPTQVNCTPEALLRLGADSSSTSDLAAGMSTIIGAALGALVLILLLVLLVLIIQRRRNTGPVVRQRVLFPKGSQRSRNSKDGLVSSLATPTTNTQTPHGADASGPRLVLPALAESSLSDDVPGGSQQGRNASAASRGGFSASHALSPSSAQCKSATLSSTASMEDVLEKSPYYEEAPEEAPVDESKSIDFSVPRQPNPMYESSDLNGNTYDRLGATRVQHARFGSDDASVQSETTPFNPFLVGARPSSGVPGPFPSIIAAERQSGLEIEDAYMFNRPRGASVGSYSVVRLREEDPYNFESSDSGPYIAVHPHGDDERQHTGTQQGSNMHSSQRAAYLPFASNFRLDNAYSSAVHENSLTDSDTYAAHPLPGAVEASFPSSAYHEYRPSKPLAPVSELVQGPATAIALQPRTWEENPLYELPFFRSLPVNTTTPTACAAMGVTESGRRGLTKGTL